jgi:hypothetical protein
LLRRFACGLVNLKRELALGAQLLSETLFYLQLRECYQFFVFAVEFQAEVEY